MTVLRAWLSPIWNLSFSEFWFILMCVLQDLKGISCRGRGTQMSVVLPCILLSSKPGLKLRVHKTCFLREQMGNSPAIPFTLYCLALKKERYSTVTSTNYWIISVPYLRNSNDERQGNQHSIVQWCFCRERKSYFLFKIPWKLCSK